MTKELHDLYAKLELLKPYFREIEAIEGQIEHIKLTCKHEGAVFVSKYFNASEVFYCKLCDSRFLKEEL